MTDTPMSPTVWRRWLAFELTRLRRVAGLEQKDVAKALRCTVTKVSYIENAERPVVLRDLDEVLLGLYGVPEDRWSSYLQAAKKSRQKGWWERYSADALPEWLSLYIGLEQGAEQLRVYDAQLITGVLQTEDYAQAIVRRGTAELTEEQISRRVEFRSSRRAVLTRELDPLRLWVVLDEAVLRRVVGNRAVMRDQLQHLADVADQAKVTLQVFPFEHGAHPGMQGPFTILDFPWPTDPGVVYIEHRSGAVYLETPAEIKDHTVAFEHLCAHALPPDESVALIRDIAREYQ
ncbi:helix-turn-helix domain-containing protein [Saccharopolyspora sp. HNM0983]|uniref:Helix-turn-helix domain-containing protein n=2 Tax=Saccharopolyspora montiporae TaxID=2781240 RepID=A0A929FY83_9PSEU|nr:helix-turn-helix domain-containing protein [Saccharopolyspora sp. HNM0983]